MFTELSSFNTVEFAMLCLIIFVVNIFIIEIFFHFYNKYKERSKSKVNKSSKLKS